LMAMIIGWFRGDDWWHEDEEEVLLIVDLHNKIFLTKIATEYPVTGTSPFIAL
jgi:hypothetical protein